VYLYAIRTFQILLPTPIFKFTALFKLHVQCCFVFLFTFIDIMGTADDMKSICASFTGTRVILVHVRVCML